MDARIECKLIVSGEAQDVLDFKESIRGEYPSYEIGHGCPSCRIELEPKEPEKHSLCFNNIVSVPEDKLKAGYPKAGMYWEINNWGVKWGAVDDRIEAESATAITYRFWTPAAPPRKWVKAASENFRKLRFILAYFGKECFPLWGIEIYYKGNLLEKMDIQRDIGINRSGNNGSDGEDLVNEKLEQLKAGKQYLFVDKQ